MARPYQPSLLRLLHGGTAALVAITWLSGLLIYNRYDGRWGRLPFPIGGDWIDLHGSAGSVLLPIAVLLGLYALSLGLRQLRRPSNAIALGALVLAIGTGLQMEGDWVEEGQLGHLIYSLHLGSWVLLTLAVAAHLGGVLKQGGWGLAGSMFSRRVKGGDWPWHWPSQLLRRFR
ncbi:MAG: cytochrome b/b6 domain-containing protein [Synechococcaceae cyanobacterium ELA445]|jgi:hypothetical protein